MMVRLVLWVVVAVSLLDARLGVQAAGRQLLATTNTSGIYYGELHAPWPEVIDCCVHGATGKTCNRGGGTARHDGHHHMGQV